MWQKMSDKRIAAWMKISIATYYRWRAAGLIVRRPISTDEAQELRRRIDLAQDNAAFARQRGQLGRTTLDAIAQALGGHP